MPPVTIRGNTSRRDTSQASVGPVFWTSMAKLPHCPTFICGGPDFLTTSTGSPADAIVTRVGSSSPETVGLAEPLTFGSSLTANVVPLARRSADWLVTTVPFARPDFSLMSNWTRTSPKTVGQLTQEVSEAV